MNIIVNSFRVIHFFLLKSSFILELRMNPGYTCELGTFVFIFTMFVIMKIRPSTIPNQENAPVFVYKCYSRPNVHFNCKTNVPEVPMAEAMRRAARKYTFKILTQFSMVLCSQTISEYPITYDFSGIPSQRFLYRVDSCAYYLCYVCLPSYILEWCNISDMAFHEKFGNKFVSAKLNLFD